MTYLRPDAKSQVTVEYDENGRPARIDTIVVSTQHDEFIDAKTEGISQDEADRRMLEHHKPRRTQHPSYPALARRCPKTCVTSSTATTLYT